MSKIVFAKSFFESFDGTQEELDALMKEVEGIFESMTIEEIQAKSRPLTEEEIKNLESELGTSLKSELTETKKKLH